MAHQPNRIGSQAVGAYGEKVVEAELLRRGWVSSNVNASIKNAADFDIFAVKNRRAVYLRVKTCGPDMNAFQFGFRPNQKILDADIDSADFTILVSMGTARQDDQFYVLPTRTVRETIDTYKQAYLKQTKRDGGNRKDTGHWTLHLPDLRSNEDRPNYGWARKWSTYRDKWESLEGVGHTTL